MSISCEADFNYHGFRVVVILCDMGHRCGYVGIPEGHPAHDIIDYDELEIYCHGGLTYGSSRAPGKEPDGRRYIGFDCAHSGDAIDKEATLKAFGKLPRCYWRGQGDVWTQGMVEDECLNIIEQLEKMASPSSK